MGPLSRDHAAVTFCPRVCAECPMGTHRSDNSDLVRGSVSVSPLVEKTLRVCPLPYAAATCARHRARLWPCSRESNKHASSSSGFSAERQNSSRDGRSQRKVARAVEKT